MAGTRQKEREGETTPTLVESFRESLQARLSEINQEIGPKLTERDEIQDMLDLMKSRRAPARASTGAPRGRRGKRMEEFLQVLAVNPGITISNAAREMGIQPNYLYRVADKALEAGKVHKGDDGSYSLADASPDEEIRDAA